MSHSNLPRKLRLPRCSSLLAVILGLLSLNATGCGWFDDLPSLEISRSATPEERSTRLDEWFTKLQTSNQFNGTVMIAQRGQPILAKGYGFTDFTKTTPLTADSSMRLGSVSKQFTGVAIMLLNKSGALSYDDPVTKYIPGFPYPNVSIRHLLNQTSGIPDNYLSLAQANKSSFTLLTNEIAVNQLIQAKQAALSPPNQEFKYSNTNYILLARIVEIISGSTFEDFMAKELFKPLGMNNSRVWHLAASTPSFPGKTSSIGRDGDTFVDLKPSFVDGVAGDGAVFSSANDMLIWDTFWYDDRLLSITEKAQAFTKPVLKNGETSNYGFGWLVDEDYVAHDGAWLGARTMIIRYPQGKALIALMDNSSNEQLNEIAQAIMEAEVFVE